MGLFGWHSIFLVLALFGLIVGVVVFLGLPESRTQATAAQAALESPLGSYRAALADWQVLGFVGASALNGASLFTYVAGSPALFISHFGQPPSAFGWIFAINALGLIIASQLNRHLLTRLPPDRIARRGSLFALGFSALLLALSALGLAGIWETMALLFLGLGSYGFVSSNSSALALGAMPQRAGAISALIGSGSFAFGATASALTAPFAAQGPLAIATGMAVGFAGSAACLHLVVRR
jgi:DHA1 family bicyclomycin/chloramphenicol resistance-like MFS transporter